MHSQGMSWECKCRQGPNRNPSHSARVRSAEYDVLPYRRLPADHPNRFPGSYGFLNEGKTQVWKGADRAALA